MAVGLNMSDALYNREILRLAASIPLTERLDDPQYSIKKTSPICGSRIVTDVNFENGKVASYGQEVRACALGQASASLMGQMVIGRTGEELLQARDELEAFLKKGGPTPKGDWSVLEIFAPAREHKSRHGSIMLPFEALADAVKQSKSDP